MKPVDIAHSRKRNAVIVTWESGVESTFGVPYLRGWCPCAACQGHGNTTTFSAEYDSVTVESLHEIGAYALGIRFSDGHDAGIFTWEWLHSISEEAPPKGLKRGSFTGGHYSPPSSEEN